MSNYCRKNESDKFDPCRGSIKGERFETWRIYPVVHPYSLCRKVQRRIIISGN